MRRDKSSIGSPIGLICAVPFESARITKTIKDGVKTSPATLTGTLCGQRVVLAASGVGMANAAATTALMLEGHAPRALISFGIGGAYHGSGLGPGDAAAATAETFAELGAITPQGFMSAADMDLPTLRQGRRKLYERIPLDKKLLRLATPHLSATGEFVTVSTVTGSTRHARALIKRLGPVMCENMEGAATALICARYKIPMLEIRGISNMVENRNRDTWEIHAAASSCQEALLKIIETIPA